MCLQPLMVRLILVPGTNCLRTSEQCSLQGVNYPKLFNYPFIIPPSPLRWTLTLISNRMENLTKRLGQSFFEFSNSVTKFNELRDVSLLTTIQTQPWILPCLNVKFVWGLAEFFQECRVHRRCQHSGALYGSNEQGEWEPSRESGRHSSESFSDKLNSYQIGSIRSWSKSLSVQKIAAFAEPRAFDHYSSLPSPKERKKDPPIPRSYFNSKLINRPPSEDKDEEEEDDEEDKYNCTFPTELPLARNDHFKTDVNLNVTSVHVPTSIYECGER